MRISLAQQTAHAQVSGRDLRTLYLGAHQDLKSLTEGGPRRACSLLLILQGDLTINGARVSLGGWAFLSSPEGRAGAGGCLLALLSWQGESPPSAAQIHPFPSLAWYEKYEASLAPLKLNDGRDDLAPWSGYWIQIPTGDGMAAMHVHHDLKNVIVIAGEHRGCTGHLLAEDDAGIHAWPLVAGDIAIVDPEVIHNLVPLMGGEPLHFFVFNDIASHYQDESHSDYHNLSRVDLGTLILEARDDARPTYFHVRVAEHG